MILRQRTTHHNPNNYKNFDKNLLDTIKLIKSWIVKDLFQRKLKEDISNIKSSLDVYALTTRLPTSIITSTIL